MEYGLFGLLCLGMVITVRAIYLLAGMIVETGVSKERDKEDLKNIRNGAIEVTILLGFLITILAIVFLFAYEGMM